jgi:nucleotide-binding universal stress UspA family protein
MNLYSSYERNLVALEADVKRGVYSLGRRTREALAVGIGLSARGSTELVVARIHAIDPAAAPDARALAELRVVGARMLEELVERGRAQGVDVRSRLVSSRHPARAIVDLAAEEGADLVLLGATPRLVGERAYFGPTADRVLADAPCAVALYVGGVRPEALRAAVPEPDGPGTAARGGTARPEPPGPTLH